MAFTIDSSSRNQTSATNILNTLKGKDINISARFINDLLYLSMRKFNFDFIDNPNSEHKLFPNYFPDHAAQIAELYENDRLTKKDLHAIITAAYLLYLINTNRYISYLSSEDPIGSIENDAVEIMNIFLAYANIVNI